ncbi:MAG: restriction endonuclease subunit S [Cyclobacteriaceae bacterium]
MQEERNEPRLRFDEFHREWSLFKIQDLLDRKFIISHLDGNHGGLYPRSEEFANEGIPYITANDFIKGFVRFENCKFLPEERAKIFKKGIAKNGDVLFAHNATVGPTAILKTKLDYVILSTTATYFRCDNKRLINYYLKYYFNTKNFINQYSRVMSQSTRNQVPITTQRNFYVWLPESIEQQKIASFLTAVDTKIEQLTKKKTLLEQYKKGVMQKVFTQEIRFKKPDGTDYPDWEERKLGDLCQIRTGKLDANAMVADGEYRFYTCAKNYYKIDKYAFDTEALLISGNGANVGYIHYYHGKFNAYQRTYVLDGFEENIAFIKCYLDRYLIDRIYSEKKDGNTPYIVMGSLSEMNIMVPNAREQTQIANFLSVIDDKIRLVSTQLEKTQEFKKGLLQQMFV